jgi:ferredoxin-type protein NapH
MKKRQKTRTAIMLFSFLLFPITIFYFSPVLIIHGAFNGILVGSAVIFIVQFFIAIFLGRLFCGWICPAGGLQDICLTVNSNKVSNRLNWVRYTIWVPWLGVIIWGFVNAQKIKTSFFFQIENGISIDEPFKYIIYFFFVILILGFSIFGGKRAFCHYVCWMSPFMISGNFLRRLLKLPSLKMATNASNCKSCGKCNMTCPMSLNVQKYVLEDKAINDTECILCGNCADGCKNKAISYKFKRI